MSLLKAHDLEATPIPQGAVLEWPYTAPIPSGWEIANGAASANDPAFTRPNMLDAYAKVCATVAEVPGVRTVMGAHAHTIPPHSHGGSGASNQSHGSNTGDYHDGSYANMSHYHTFPAAGAIGLGATLAEPASIYSVPIVYTLKAGGSGKGLPRLHDLKDSALPPWRILIGWPHNLAIPAGWSKTDGSTVNNVVLPNLLGKYLRGIPNTVSAPGAVGGSSTHDHDATHWHVSGVSSSDISPGDINPGTVPNGSHDHNLPNWSGRTDAGSNELSRVTTHILCFTGHGPSAAASPLGVIPVGEVDPVLLLPRGIMAGYAHSLSLPAGWSHADGGAWANGTPAGLPATRPNALDRFVKHAASGGGTPFGANTHVHSGLHHDHGVSSGPLGGEGGSPNGGSGAPRFSHTHPGTVSSFYPGFASSNVPVYQTIAYMVRD